MAEKFKFLSPLGIEDEIDTVPLAPRSHQRRRKDHPHQRHRGTGPHHIPGETVTRSLSPGQLDIEKVVYSHSSTD